MQQRTNVKSFGRDIYIKQNPWFIGNNRHTGHEYSITVWEDYRLLESHVNLLDRVLERLKSKNNGKTEAFHTAFTPLSQTADVKVNEITIN